MSVANGGTGSTVEKYVPLTSLPLSVANGGTGSTVEKYLPLVGGTIKALSGNTGLGIDTTAGLASYVQGAKNGAGRWVMYLGNGDAESGSNAGSNFKIDRFADNGTYLGEALVINRASGVVSLPAQPSFFAYGVNQAGQNSDFIFSFTYWNTGNRYNTSNGRFTAATAGIYFFRFNVMADSPGGPYEIRLSLYKNGFSPGINYILNKPATAYLSMEVSGHVYLGAGDYITARYVQGIATWYTADSVWSSFSGHFVG